MGDSLSHLDDLLIQSNETTTFHMQVKAFMLKQKTFVTYFMLYKETS